MTNIKLLIRNFIRRLTIFTAVIAILAVFFRLMAPPEYITPGLFILLAFFYLLTAGIYGFVVYSAQKRIAKFNTRFMLTTVVKLFLFMIILFLYILFNMEDAVNFLITFLIYYLLFTGFEIYNVVKHTRRINPEG